MLNPLLVSPLFLVPSAHVVIKFCLFVLSWFAGLNGKAENGSDSTNKDRMMPDLCVICLEQEYNSVFVP